MSTVINQPVVNIRKWNRTIVMILSTSGVMTRRHQNSDWPFRVTSIHSPPTRPQSPWIYLCKDKGVSTVFTFRVGTVAKNSESAPRDVRRRYSFLVVFRLLVQGRFLVRRPFTYRVELNGLRRLRQCLVFRSSETSVECTSPTTPSRQRELQRRVFLYYERHTPV